MENRKIFKCGLKPTDNTEINDELFNDCVNNNYAIYGWKQSYSFNNMTRGDLLVINKGHKLYSIGEVVLPPCEFYGFKNLSSIPILDRLNKEKFSLENEILSDNAGNRKWVIIHVKKFYDIKIFTKEHKSQSAGEEILQQDLVTELNNIFNYISNI